MGNRTMATELCFLSGRQITNDAGTPQSGAKLYFYRETTTTALTVWTNDAASVAHANPVVCDSGGFVPLIYIDDTYDYKVVIKTSADVTLQTYDEIPAPPAASTTGYYPELRNWYAKTNAQSPVALTAADAGNAYEADTTAGNVEFDLPSAATVGNGKGFTFKKMIAANSMIIDQSGTETIDNSATAITVTNQYEVVHIISNGAEWYVSSRYYDTIVAARLPAASDTAAGIQENAIQSEMEAAASTTLTVTPGLLHNHPGVPKFWVRADVAAGTPSISASHNVTSITDTAVGRLTITIATDFSSVSWVCNPNIEYATGSTVTAFSSDGTIAAGTVEVACSKSGVGLSDPTSWHVLGLGDQ